MTAGADGNERARAFLRVDTPADALTAAALESLAGEPLIAFLLARRWFGAKGGRPAEARVADVIRIPWGGGEFAIARLDVRDEGGTRRYQLPLCLRARDAIPTPPPRAVLARVAWVNGEGLLFDAVEDGIFRRRLAEAFITPGGESFRGERTRWVIEPVEGNAFVAPDQAHIRLGSAEQSNTSIIFGRHAILKLFRRLEPGQHPDVEMTRFLTVHSRFAHTPKLLGTILLEDSSASVTVAGMLQEYLPGSVDAWSYALECGAVYFNPAKASGSANAFAVAAERLGVITRELHDALATGDDDAFAPEPVTPEHVEGWAQRTQHSIREGLALLDRQVGAERLSNERAAEARVLVRRRDQYLSLVDEIVDALVDDAGFRIRIHGDYHLGQILRTPTGDFMVIDFEGEPARTLAERREKASPLRDVAGMLRSFAYASATIAINSRPAGTAPSTAVEVNAARWERDAREAFVRGYGRGADALGVIPRDPANVQKLLGLFEMEKVFYELIYELNNRPDWAWIPMRGISKLMVR